MVCACTHMTCINVDIYVSDKIILATNCKIYGDRNRVMGSFNDVVGNKCKIVGDENGITGNENRIKGQRFMVRGHNNSIKGLYGVVDGNNNDIVGDFMDVFGSGNKINGLCCTLNEEPYYPKKHPGIEEIEFDKEPPNNGPTCVICYVNTPCCVILPCMHLCVCISCSVELAKDNKWECPICKEEIDAIRRVFMSVS